MREPNCQACALEPEGKDCGGHWAPRYRKNALYAPTVGKISLDVYDGSFPNHPADTKDTR